MAAKSRAARVPLTGLIIRDRDAFSTSVLAAHDKSCGLQLCIIQTDNICGGAPVLCYLPVSTDQRPAPVSACGAQLNTTKGMGGETLTSANGLESSFQPTTSCLCNLQQGATTKCKVVEVFFLEQYTVVVLGSGQGRSPPVNVAHRCHQCSGF